MDCRTPERGPVMRHPVGTGDTSRIRRLVRGPSGAPMQGDVADFPLADLLQFLAQSRTTGHLALERGDPPQVASLVFHDGRLVDARCPPQGGDEAVIALLGWRHGRFLVLSGPTPAHGNVTADLPALLLEGARWADEVARALDGLPPEDAVLYPVHRAGGGGAVLSRLAWNLLTHVDGERTLLELVQGFSAPQPIVAQALADLWRAGLVATTPDTAFLARITVRRQAEPTGDQTPADQVLAATVAPRTLADLVLASGLPVEDLLRTVVALVDAGWMDVVAGQDAWEAHLDQVIPERS